MLLSEALDRKLRSISSSAHNSPKTASWYKECVNSFCAFLLEKGIEPTVANLTVDNVEWYLADLRTRFDQRKKDRQALLSPNTVASRIRCLRAFASWLYQRDCTRDHQLAKIPVPNDVLEEPEVTEPWEIGKLVKSIDVKAPYGCRDVCIILTLYDLGLRCGELCNLKIEDVNLEARTAWIYVRASTTKSRRARPVPLGSTLHRLLELYIERHRDNNDAHIRKNPQVDYLFPNRNGQQFTTNGILQMLYRRCDEAGIRRLHPHLLRHSNAILEIESGVPEPFVMQKLGHSDLSTTDYYSHLAARRSILKQTAVCSTVDPIDTNVDRPRKQRGNKGKPRKVKPVPAQSSI